VDYWRHVGSWDLEWPVKAWVPESYNTSGGMGSDPGLWGSEPSVQYGNVSGLVPSPVSSLTLRERLHFALAN
jgi:hypothetical protein